MKAAKKEEDKKSKLNNLTQRLKSIATYQLVTQSSSVIEKLFWSSIAISGTIWGFYFIVHQFQTWEASPHIVTRANVQLFDLNYPAITLCSKGNSKYAIAERLGNYLNPEADLPEDLLDLRKEFALCITEVEEGAYKKGFQDWKMDQFKSACNLISRKKRAWSIIKNPGSVNLNKNETKIEAKSSWPCQVTRSLALVQCSKSDLI